MESTFIMFLVSLVVLVGLMIMSVPVPFCFAASLLFLASVSGFDASLQLKRSYYMMSSLSLIAVPLFIAVGLFLNEARLADRLVDIAHAFVGRFKSSLGASAVVACAMTGAIVGTFSAAAAAVGSIMIPEMEKEGYSRGYSSALVACSAVLGQLIPPNVGMILYAFVARTSVLACFLSTVGPGILLIVVFCLVNMVMVRNMPIKTLPSVGGLLGRVKGMGRSLRRGFFTLLVPAAIFGGIYGGFVTPSESGGVAVFIILVIGIFIYRTLNWKNIINTFMSTGTTAGVILLMMFFAVGLTRLEVLLNIPQEIIALFTGISSNPLIVLFMVNVFLFILGMFVGDFTAIVLITPLLLPLMVSIGVHPVHFGAIMCTNLGLGSVTPPFAPILYLTARIGNVTVDKVLKPALVYMLAMVPVVLVTTYWTDLVMALPRFVLPQIMG